MESDPDAQFYARLKQVTEQLEKSERRLAYSFQLLMQADHRLRRCREGVALKIQHPRPLPVYRAVEVDV